MHALNSGLARGTSTSPQTSLEQNEYANKVVSNEEKAEKQHQDHLRNSLPASSPVHIPNDATIIEQHKMGYEQVKYRWSRGEFKYEARWHTKTPNAPRNQGPSWVVIRKRSGIGNGPKARKKKVEVLVGKEGNNYKWISLEDWHAAIRAKNKGIATKKQKEMLNNGHWKAE